MPLDAINDGAIPSENTDEICAIAIPDEDVAVVTPCCNVVVSVAKEDGFLDVCVCVAVATVPTGIVTDQCILAGLIRCEQTSTISGVMATCASIRSCAV